MSQNYLGIDVHKKWCVYTQIDSTGKIMRQSRFRNTLEEVSTFASSLNSKDHLVLEPVLNYLWILDQFEPYVGSVHVATPFKVRVIAESKSKTDKYDSRMLAELLRTNFLPESWVPPSEIRMLRGLIRQRYHLVKSMVMNKNRIRHLLFQYGIDLKVFNIASPRARLEIQHLCLPDITRETIDQCLKIIALLDTQIREISKRIWECVKDNPTVELLQTIPGIGKIRSAVVYAEVGNVTRFHSAKALASYTGLTPTVRSSGDSIWTGGITCYGSKPLRHALVEASINAIRKSPALNRMYHRILYRGNVQKARVAVARKLAVIIYAMLNHNEPFRMEAA
jgi:transposase